MESIYEIIDSVTIGTLDYSIQQLSNSVRSAGGSHDTDVPQIVIINFYNHLNPKSPHCVADKFPGVTYKGVGTSLLRRLALEANKQGKANIYVSGTKRQSWDVYKNLGFLPLGTMVLNWYTTTVKLLDRTKHFKAIAQTAAPGGDAVRVPQSLFSSALNALARESAPEAEKDPKDPRTRDGVVIKL